MESRDQRFENVAPVQNQQSADDIIAPPPTESQLLHDNAAGAGDAEWRRLNLLSLGITAQAFV